MPRKPRIYYTETDKALMWERCCPRISVMLGSDLISVQIVLLKMLNERSEM
jgi:hypothetical protein